ncbi:MAG: YfhO family protein [Eubacterium sp.]|nr:YfhO family protein [Eubacterium sp.]
MADNSLMTTFKYKMRKYFGRNWSWIISAAITAVFMLTLMITAEVAPFGVKSFTLVDSIHQYIPFFSDYQNKLKAGESLFFTWDIGFGQNFLSLLLYYMASPLNLILVFIARENIVAMFSLLVALKIVISAGAFSYFLSRRKGAPKNNTLIVAMGLGYALNNYMCGYFWNIMWLDCIMVFPLIILGFERLVNDRDPRLYIAALFYSLYANYYISFIICIFLVLWFFVRSHKNVKKFFTDGLVFAGSSLLAAGMAALSLLIAFLAITKTSTAGAALPKAEWYQSFFELLKGQYFLTKPIKMDVFDGKANLYCSTLAIILLFIYIFSNRIKPGEKIRHILLVLFLLASMNHRLLNFIWHGFHDQFGIPNRFSFIYIFVILYLGYEALIRLRKTHIVSVMAGIFASCILLGFVHMKAGLDGQVDKKYMLLISFILILVYGTLLILRKLDLMPIVVSTVVLSVLMAAELILNGALGISNNGLCDIEYYMQYSKQMEETVAEVDEMAKEKGLLFYRQDIIEPIMMDENTYDGMKSIGTFCSTANGRVVDTMAYFGFYTGENEYLYKGACPVTNDIFGVRYIYVRDGDYFPYADEMKLVLEKEGLKVYENESALPLAFGVRENINSWSCGSFNAASVLGHFAEYATGSEEVFRIVHPFYGVGGEGCEAVYDPKSPDVISYSNGTGDTITVRGTFVVGEEGEYFLNARANYLEKLDYYLNDNLMTAGRNHGQILCLGDLKEGDRVNLVMTFNQNYSKNGTISMYMSMIDRTALTQMRAYLTKNKMKMQEVKEDYIKGEVNLEKNQILFTTIPYDEGWSAYVDGKKVKINNDTRTFIELDVGEGVHTVEFKFVPKGFKLGLIISIICWIGYIVLFVLIRKKKYNIKTLNN